MSTIVITGARVVDGTGSPAVRSDVAISDGRIVAIGQTHGLSGTRIDLTGLTLAPGFVDIHAHSDLSRMAYPLGETRILQGITTEVIGNCGLSPAPTGSDPAGLRALVGPIDVVSRLPLPARTTSEFLDELSHWPAAWNVAPLVGHGAVRFAVMGDASRAANPREAAAMSALVDEALKAGYWGLSLGLMYAPGEAAHTDELVALARVVARYDALLAAHMRRYDGDGLADAVREVLDVAAQSQARLQISHLRSVADPHGAGLRAALQIIENTTANVEADAYPYIAGHTTMMQLLPAPLRASGASAVLAALQAHPNEIAERLRSEFLFSPEAITIAKAGDGSSVETGRTLAELAADPDPGTGSSSGDWADRMVAILAKYQTNVDVIVVGTRPQDAAAVLRKPYVSVASDGVALSLGHRENLPHPRSTGTFARAIRELTDAGMPIEAVVHKMTAKPATRLGMTDRGIIAPGMVADLVAFDPHMVTDHASYAEPLLPPTGIEHVWVAGEQVVKSAQVTGSTPGRVLRRPR